MEIQLGNFLSLSAQLRSFSYGIYETATNARKEVPCTLCTPALTYYLIGYFHLIVVKDNLHVVDPYWGGFKLPALNDGLIQ